MLRLVPVLMAALVCWLYAAEAMYVAEVKIYVDKSGVAKWKKLLGKTEEVDLRLATTILFTEMNAIYETLKPNVDLQLRLKELVLMDKNVFATNTIFQGDAVAGFYNFLRTDYTKGDYDLAMLFTGSDETSQYSKKAYGASYQAKVCTEFASGTTEIFDSDLMAVMTAHEIGHILGAPHDEGCQQGWWSKGDIMNTYTKPNSPNRFKFSYCSSRNIYNTIALLDQNQNDCLTDHTDLTAPELKDQAPDTVCKLLDGHFYSLNRGKYPTVYGDAFCETLHCVGRIDKAFKYTTHDMPEGMPCGHNKRCSDKKCVTSPDGDPEMQDVCPYGDQDVTEWGYKTLCPDKDCKKGNWAKFCCQSCQQDEEFGKK